jgi:hypothetical protein
MKGKTMTSRKTILSFAAICLFFSALGGDLCLADQIYVRQNVEGVFEGRVLEESEDSFLIRVPKTQILRVERADAPIQSSSSDVHMEQKLLRLEKEFEEFKSGRRYDQKTIASEVLAASTGKIRGKVLAGGNPLANCDVRLSRLPDFSVAAFRSSSSDKSTSEKNEFVARTDSQGRYFFKELPPGSYRIAWRPAGHVNFVRRLKSEPDVELSAGEVVEYKDIEVNVATIN